MTNSDYTHITFVMDRSGSMGSKAEDAIGGFNQLLKEHQDAPGKASMTLVLFDHEYIVKHELEDIQKVEPLTRSTYVPRGMTALMDATGRAIATTGEKLAAMPEGERPGKVLVAILTDGLENASKEISREELKKTIKKQEDEFGWAVIYVASGLDAWGHAQAIGISAQNYAGGEGRSVKLAMGAVARASTSYRAGQSTSSSVLGEDAGNVE